MPAGFPPGGSESGPPSQHHRGDTPPPLVGKENEDTLQILPYFQLILRTKI